MPMRRAVFRTGRGEREVFRDRHFLGAPREVEVGLLTALVKPRSERIAQHLASLRERDANQIGEQLRHEHAVDEQRIRYRDVVERGMSA